MFIRTLITACVFATPVFAEEVDGGTLNPPELTVRWSFPAFD